MTAPGRDATMSVAQANLVGIAWLPLSGLLTLGPFLLLWGAEPLSAATRAAPGLRVVLPVVILSILAHETLHAVGFLTFGRAPRRTVRLGFQWRSITPYASCSIAIPASAYRAAGLLPALALGAAPAVAAWVLGSGGLVLWAWAMLAVAGGDLAAIWAMRGVPGRTLVLDHPSRVGCRVEEADAGESVFHPERAEGPAPRISNRG